MDASELQALLEEFAKLEEAPAQIDTLLRTRRKVLAFRDAKSLEDFYQPLFLLADLVRHQIGQQKRMEAIEARLQDTDRRQAQLEAKVAALIAEREALLLTNQAMITCIRAIDQAITYLETHKFKYSVYDLIGKINEIIRPDERASYEIEGSGMFEPARFSAARAAEPHMTIQRLFEAGQGRLPELFAGDSPHLVALKQLLEHLRQIEGENAERARNAQKFGIRLKVVNREGEAEPASPVPSSPPASRPEGKPAANPPPRPFAPPSQKRPAGHAVPPAARPTLGPVQDPPAEPRFPWDSKTGKPGSEPTRPGSKPEDRDPTTPDDERKTAFPGPRKPKPRK